MNSAVHSKMLELLKLLSYDEAEADEVEGMTPVLELTLSNPQAYLEDNPDEEWLAQGHPLDQLPPSIAQDLFKWNLGLVLGDYSISGDKGDEIAEAVVDTLQDYDVNIELPELKNWFEYDAYIEKELIKAKSNIKLVTLDISFSDEATIFLVPREKFDQLTELLRFFGVTRIQLQ